MEKLAGKGCFIIREALAFSYCAGMAELVDATDSRIGSPLGKRRGKKGIKLGEPLTGWADGNAEPSPDHRRGRCRGQTVPAYVPTLSEYGKGMVQTTNVPATLV